MRLRLYDLVGADDLRFSPYCFRAKLALAIKEIDYDTVPVPFTGISGIGRGSFKTVPVLEDRGALVGDSFAIAEHLEANYRGPALFMPGDQGRSAARFVEGMMNAVVQPAMSPLMGADIHARLMEVDKAYFRRTREYRFGKTLEAARAEREQKLPEVRRLLVPLRHALRKSPFLGGASPTFLDAIPFGTIAWAEAVGTLDLLADDPVLTPWFLRCAKVAGATFPNR